MELFELNQQLSKKQLQPFYVFTGPEVAIMDIYIKQITTLHKGIVKRADSVEGIFSQLQNNSFINKPSCYIIRDDKNFLTAENVWEKLTTGAIQGANVIIMIYTNIDQRNKFYKQNKEVITAFDKLAPEVLANYIQREIGLESRHGIKLAEMCDCDYSRILLECDKLRHLSLAQNCDITTAFIEALKSKLIYISPKDVIFDLVDAICKRQAKRSFDLWEELQQVNESPLGVISILYTNMKSMLLVQSAGQCNDLGKRTGLTGWQIKLAKEKGNRYSINELVRAIRLIRETEKGIKTGGIEAGMALDYIMINLL